MGFPKALDEAVMRGNKILISANVSDDDMVEYMNWKMALGLGVLTVAKLRALHRRGHHTKEIFKMFKINKKINYLSEESKRRHF